MSPRHVTPQPWAGGLQHASYGAPDTYAKAAAWLSGCRTVEDWGGAAGHLRAFLAPDVDYHVVDGTLQGSPEQRLADLRTYRSQVDGIAIRHVLDLNPDWRAILDNAMASCRRLVVVTFTLPAEVTHIERMKSGWPLLRFQLQDIRAALSLWRVADEAVWTTHPEHVFYAERPCAS